jgi:hypothetical protein
MNISRIPLRYRIVLPVEADGILSISQSVGLVRGNEDLVLTIFFAPQQVLFIPYHKLYFVIIIIIQAIKYNFKLKLKTYPIGGKCGRIIDSRQIGVVEQPEILQSISIDIIAPGI